MSLGFYEQYFDEIKKKYPIFKEYKDYQLFTLVCMKYFFFSEDSTPFDQDMISDTICDGPYDGGIDAIFNNPESTNNDIIIIQSKYYSSTNVTESDVAGEIYKISQTIKKLKENKVSTYNEKLVTAFANAQNQMSEDGNIEIYFFTSFKPKTKLSRSKIEKVAKNLDISFRFQDDIEDEISFKNTGKMCVANDKIIIDEKNNVLRFENSILVNVSAKSLQDLQHRYRNGLLGLNLRYHVKDKKVDQAVEKTIKNEPENFWYKNNGIVIICDDFTFDGKVIKLDNFSIINGGQTTSLIGKIDLPNKDFFIQCKIIKTKGSTDNDKGNFIHKIAEATNSQKPIKISDLRANSHEQLILKEKLFHEGIHYITKRGEVIQKGFKEPLKNTKVDTLGKVALAGVIQMPGSARSKPSLMYSEEYYYDIFGKSISIDFIIDVLKLDYYYEQFKKTKFKDKGFDEITVLPVMRNGKTYQIACICLLAKLEQDVFTDTQLAEALNNVDELKKLLRKTDGITRIFKNKLNDEREVIFKIFSIIGDDVLGYCFGNALEKAQEEKDTITATNYLKTDANYYKYVIKRLRSRYNQGELKSLFEKI